MGHAYLVHNNAPPSRFFGLLSWWGAVQQRPELRGEGAVEGGGEDIRGKGRIVCLFGGMCVIGFVLVGRSGEGKEIKKEERKK